MIDFIQEFIDSKSLSENSKNAYFYDLQQFVEAVDGKVSKEKLALYEHSLAPLKTSAKKRKISAVNQFLYFLYDTDRLDRFYKLSNKEKLASKPVNKELLDYSAFYQESPHQAGQLIALLMIELGLSSSDLQGLKVTDLDKTFAVLRVQKAGLVRVLEVPEKLLDYMTANLSEEQIYLFDNQGKSYSRQWFFNQLKAFLASLGLEDLSAQDMRRQYVLHQKAAGKSLLEVSRNLGLKSPVTLEKFYN
ncbi:site-specific tyrosine recombinase XerD [Streptococcus lutetiensis]|uniref:site-specific tyrosine recombinase XerD n=1 Tax=Streptococcus lutetiensis TaxID=150055 RepID=UPI0019659A93|nr:site-specific tyrosine recombinase XerD [Streptococcus lutetiensis]